MNLWNRDRYSEIDGSIKFSNPTKGQIHILLPPILKSGRLREKKGLTTSFKNKKQKISGFGSIEITGEAFWVRVGFRRFPKWPIFKHTAPHALLVLLFANVFAVI